MPVHGWRLFPKASLAALCLGLWSAPLSADESLPAQPTAAEVTAADDNTAEPPPPVTAATTAAAPSTDSPDSAEPPAPATPTPAAEPSTAKKETTAAKGATADQAETYVLAYKFLPNQEARYEVDHHMELMTKQGSQSETVKYHTHEWKHYRVAEVDAQGDGTLELTMDRVRMSVQFDEHPEETFDSTGPPSADGKFHEVRMSVGKPQARIRVSRAGQLLTIDTLQATWKGPVSKSPLSDMQQGDPKRNFLDQNVLVGLPEGPVKIGHQWNEKYEVRVNLGRLPARPVTLRRQYELKSVSGHLATIKMSTAVLTPVQDPAISVQLVQMQPSGTVVFDMDAGTIISRDIAMDEKVIGPWGANSLVHTTSHRGERLLKGPSVAEKSN